MGRIGSAGRLVSSRFASEEEAALAMAEHLKAKLSRGYEADRVLCSWFVRVSVVWRTNLEVTPCFRTVLPKRKLGNQCGWKVI